MDQVFYSKSGLSSLKPPRTMQIKIGQIYKVKPEFRRNYCIKFNDTEDAAYIRFFDNKHYNVLNQNKDLKNHPELIGQFGVGFYSAFMVADKVSLITKKAGTNEATKWESEGSGYTIEETSKEGHGTEITLHLKKETEDFASEWRLKEIVKKYSDFIEHPVQMNVETDEYPLKDGKPDYEAKPTKKVELQTLNSRKAIWLKDKKEITADDYKEFYKHVSHDFNDPLETIHFSAEGKLEFKALLFLPGKAPHDLFWPEAKRGIQLYVKKSFHHG
jgi:molecular chaperone HtpG